MIPTRDILEGKTVDELRTMLVAKGAGYHHNEKQQTLIDRLLEITMTMQPTPREPDMNMQTQQTATPLQPKGAIPALTPAEVMAKIEHYKSQGLQIKFSDDGLLWHFKRHAGVLREKDKAGVITERPIIKEDSGTMRQPLERIVACAKHVMAGGALSDVMSV